MTRSRITFLRPTVGAGGEARKPLAGGALGATAEVSPSGDARIDGLLSGHAWAGGAIRYADPDSRLDYEAGHAEAFRDFARIDAGQRAAVRAALDAEAAGAGAGFSVEGFTALDVLYVGAGGGAEVRFANTSDPWTAYAYLPGDHAEAGDVFFGRAGRDPVVGGYDHFTILHEIGHALGLKHAHEGDSFGALPSAWDSPEFSVMTYRSHVGARTDGLVNEDFGFPQTFMMLDIAALQHLYGADYETNAGNTRYAWGADGSAYVDGDRASAPGADRVFQTIWDGGGMDVYDLRNHRADLRIDLTPGGWSVFSTDLLADLGGGPNGGLARGNVFNALLHRGDPRSLIENAAGGVGDDVILGNFGANRLVGGAGADVLRGRDGTDRLAGGGGRDVLAGGGGGDVLAGGRGADVFRFLSAGDSDPQAPDRLRRGDGGAAFEGAGRAPGDRIDLSAIDADPRTEGRQDFVFGAAGGAGRLWAVDVGGDTHLRGNVDGGRGWDFELIVADRGVAASEYAAADFVGLG